ncbi:hypothetical protein D3C75_1045190 [compost metagenome]
MAAGGSQELRIVSRGAACPSGKRPVFNSLVLIGHQKIRVHNHLHPQAVTFRTGAEGAVEGEHPGGQLLHAEAAFRTCQVLAEQKLLMLHGIHQYPAFSQL